MIYILNASIENKIAFAKYDISTTLLLVGTGIITTIPLVWFTFAARRLSLVTLGFLQYLSPSTQLLLAVFLYNEPFSTSQIITFGLIWSGLIIYSIDSRLKQTQVEAI